MDWLELGINIVKVVVIYVGLIQVVPVMIWVERKGAALIQDRPGPNRVGPMGIFQPIADALKFLFKEDPVPLQVNKLLFNLAPFLALIPASLTIAAIPIADHVVLFGRTIPVQIANIDVGVLYIMAVSSLGVYGILFGGWASNNKFSLMGAMRSSSQVISYELPLGLAAAGAVTWFGTLNLRDMVYAQQGTYLGGLLPHWGIFAQPLGFLVFFVSAFAETNRLPFDLPETEAELVGGFHTEYGSMKFATFFMAEYMSMASISALMATMYFGGWQLPYISDAWLRATLSSHNLVALIQVAVFTVKVALFMLVFVWVRWTIPRFRFDQLMRLAWGNLMPLGLLNLFITAVILYFRVRPA